MDTKYLNQELVDAAAFNDLVRVKEVIKLGATDIVRALNHALYFNAVQTAQYLTKLV
jgi:hypothetical protein